jgi:hypothetical protein
MTDDDKRLMITLDVLMNVGSLLLLSDVRCPKTGNVK